ncbi:hypothetical protein CT690_24065 [Serratia plymuthica]|uniref:Uncharacterized protein n=1 Tax=Serratia plymuthica TaxID=82996 RepID=A0A318NRZ8_SERPL|nr:hypothetical protein CT690_24065 [Serratia plymuthica]
MYNDQYKLDQALAEALEKVKTQGRRMIAAHESIFREQPSIGALFVVRKQWADKRALTHKMPGG